MTTPRDSGSRRPQPKYCCVGGKMHLRTAAAPLSPTSPAVHECEHEVDPKKARPGGWLQSLLHAFNESIVLRGFCTATPNIRTTYRSRRRSSRGTVDLHIALGQNPSHTFNKLGSTYPAARLPGEKAKATRSGECGELPGARKKGWQRKKKKKIRIFG